MPQLPPSLPFPLLPVPAASELPDSAIALSTSLPLWRAVEAQHIAATRALVDSLAEQAVLEQVLEQSKPRLPPGCEGLDYLLSTPFRYPPLRGGSRFRARTDPGVWYGAEAVRSACAEVGYWRCRFVADSAGLRELEAVPHTVFRACASGNTIDLRLPPLASARQHWTDPADYGPCQTLAQTARTRGVQLIRYASVRDPHHGGCAAVLDCRSFRGGRGVVARQSWFLSTTRNRASWIRSGERTSSAQPESYEFDFG